MSTIGREDGHPERMDWSGRRVLVTGATGLVGAWLTRALLEKGYSAEDIRKIYGGNFLRVMRAVEAAAGK